MKEDQETERFEISLQITHLSENALQIFAYPTFCIEFKEENDFKSLGSSGEISARQLSLATISKACMRSSLMALRELDDFFTERNRYSKSDDLKISDFHISESLTFLTKDERKHINKLIAHSTHEGFLKTDYPLLDYDEKEQLEKLRQRSDQADNRKAGVYRWDLHELISKGAAQFLTFCDLLESKFKEEGYFPIGEAIFIARVLMKMHHSRLTSWVQDLDKKNTQ